MILILFRFRRGIKPIHTFLEISIYLPTDPTTLTVELALIHIIKKFADPTEIFPTKHSLTVRGGAQVRDSLPGRAHQAHHLIHRASVKSVIVGHILIMTKSAS